MQALLGDPGNRRQLRRAVSRVVGLRRYEQMSVQHALHRLRQTQMPALRGSPGALQCPHIASACNVAPHTAVQHTPAQLKLLSYRSPMQAYTTCSADVAVQCLKDKQLPGCTLR